MRNLQALIEAARGLTKADMVFRNGKLINVFTGEIIPSSFAVKDGFILGFGEYQAEAEVDLAGKWVCPGLIDGHVHIESSMLTPGEFARAVLPHGTTTVVIDPHEIANVCGAAGINYMLEASADLPLRVYVMLPSCVPATKMETAGAELGAGELAAFIDHPRVLGLGELMDFPAVLQAEERMLEKLALGSKKRIDGHAPGVSGPDLAAYVLAGAGSDHECTKPEEALERLRLGMRVMLREGSAARNLRDLLPAVTPENARRCIFVTDDRHPKDLLQEGHIDFLVRTAIAAGINPIRAIQMATLNTAEWFGLRDVGALVPGFRADFLILEDLERFEVSVVYQGGRKVAEHGQPLFSAPVYFEEKVMDSVKVGDLDRETLLAKLAIPAKGSQAQVIGLIPHQIVTEKLVLTPPVINGCFVASGEEDLAKLAVVERHRRSGRVGTGLVKGLGLQQGAIASSVAHDSNNIVAVGVNDRDLALAIEAVVSAGGGLAVVNQGCVLGLLPLPIAGLMSDQSAAEVDQKLAQLHGLARNLGVKEDFDPFMTLSFLSLPVIPSLKLTDMGLVDFGSWSIIPVSLGT